MCGGLIIPHTHGVDVVCGTGTDVSSAAIGGALLISHCLGRFRGRLAPPRPGSPTCSNYARLFELRLFIRTAPFYYALLFELLPFIRIAPFSPATVSVAFEGDWRHHDQVPRFVFENRPSHLKTILLVKINKPLGENKFLFGENETFWGNKPVLGVRPIIFHSNCALLIGHCLGRLITRFMM